MIGAFAYTPKERKIEKMDLQAAIVEEEIVERPDGQYELDGDMVISDFLELVGIKEKDFDAESETVGGWTIEMFGAFPKPDDSFRYGNMSVTVLEMDGLRVEKVLVKILPPEEEQE